MAQKSEHDLTRHPIRLVAGDFEAMGRMFPSIGASVAIRTLVHNFVKRVRASTEVVDLGDASDIEVLDQ